MKIYLNLKFTDNDEKPFILNLDSNGDNCFVITLMIPFSLKTVDIFNSDCFLKMLKEELEYMKADVDADDIYSYSIEHANKLLEFNGNYLECISDIEIEYSDVSLDYIKSNSLLEKFNIILEGDYSISHNDLNELEDFIKECPDINIQVEGNRQLVTLSEYKKTVEAIDGIVEKIKKYSLSPLEQVMYAYDLVRERIYKEELETESKTISRDITSVLLGNNIVCVGFANIFDKVLLNLGIKTMMYSIKNVDETKPGHRRNIAYIKDEKYGIEGVYYFDTTWDSKKNIYDDNYLMSYKFFCRLKEDIEKYDSRFTDRTFSGLDEDLVWKFEEIVEEKGLKGVPKKMINTINEVSEFIDEKVLINPLLLRDFSQNKDIEGIIQIFIKSGFEFEKVMNVLRRYNKLFFYNSLDINTLLKILIKVRKIEYYECPEKYPLSENIVKRIIHNSDWLSGDLRFYNEKNFLW